MIDAVTLWKDDFYHDKSGRPYVRVSTVLKEFGFIDGQHFDDDSRMRGTAVHKAVEFRFKGTLNEKTLDPQLAGWIDAVDSFIDEKKFVPQVIEKNVSDPDYSFAGRLDVFGMMNDAPALIDIKSGAAGKAAILQTSAYAHCVGRALKIRRIPTYALELRDNGRYKITRFPNDNSQGVFLGLASAYWWKKNAGMIRRQ